MNLSHSGHAPRPDSADALGAFAQRHYVTLLPEREKWKSPPQSLFVLNLTGKLEDQRSRATCQGLLVQASLNYKEDEIQTSGSG